MGSFFLDGEVVRVSFADGQWVDLKEELTQEDSDYIINAMTQTVVGSEAKVEIKLGRVALLERSIVAWSFKDDKGIPYPITKESISKLRVKYRNKVLSEVDRLNREADEFSKNSLRAST